jgi:hypothetical protein
VEEKEVGGNGAEKKEKNDKQTSRSGNAAIKTKKKKFKKIYFSLSFYDAMEKQHFGSLNKGAWTLN